MPVPNCLADTSDFLLYPAADPGWLLVEDGVNPAREREIESLFAIGNGYLGIRASIAEGTRFSHPSTFVAGVFVPDGGLGPRLAVLPDWTHIEVKVEEERLSLEAGRALAHRRGLDLRRGVLWREWRQQDPSGRVTRLTYVQLISVADQHVLLQSAAITAENYAGRLSLTARLYPSDAAGTDVEEVVAKSGALLMRVAGKEIGIATASEVRSLGSSVPPRHETGPDGREERWSWEATRGETMRFDRIFAVFTSRDVANPAKAARDHIASIGPHGFRTAGAAHVNAWRRRWEEAEVRIVGDDEAQRALRFATYHLIAAANSADEPVSVGARGLTGEAYRGHVFWDTEIYMLPFYILTDPPTARALLMYRYHTLEAARRKAKEHGYEGALYAWESADTGDETTPRRAVLPDGRIVTILTGEREHHISADIAYAVWQYWRASVDDSFMLEAGAEILVETARFWLRRAQIEPDGRAHRKVARDRNRERNELESPHGCDRRCDHQRQRERERRPHGRRNGRVREARRARDQPRGSREHQQRRLRHPRTSSGIVATASRNSAAHKPKPKCPNTASIAATASILGNIVSVCSWTCVAACRIATNAPTAVATSSTGSVISAATSSPSRSSPSNPSTRA